jgi:protein-S-isoprenylcysteine O-methyltransferase Ste14
MRPDFAILLLWVVWALSWFAAAAWTNTTIKRAGLLRELPYRFLVLLGAYLLLGLHSSHYDLLYRFWRPLTGIAGWVLFLLVFAGLAFSWWARLYLGRMWSSSITRKSAHHVVDTGPYRFVRHPIYTGITVASLATAVMQGAPSTFLGAALMTAGWYIKARLEERFLREELGPEAYDSYARRVPMLVPFVHWPL